VALGFDSALAQLTGYATRGEWQLIRIIVSLAKEMAMAADVYYFSGTGNSYIVARDIAEGIRGNLIPIPGVIDDASIPLASETVGIVFPVYFVPLGGLPEIVKRFVQKLRDIQSTYIFAVCTYGSAEAGTLQALSRMVGTRGGEVAAEFTVNMPSNIHPHLASKKHTTMHAVWSKNAGAVCDAILNRKRTHLDLPNTVVGGIYRPVNFLVTFLKRLYVGSAVKYLQNGAGSSSRLYNQLLPNMDRSFTTNEKCTGCRTCVKVCPVKNIELVNGRPLWQHHCEYCLACYSWCPNEAIESCGIESAHRYHHPDVEVSDLIV
jgi:ferredoxin